MSGLYYKRSQWKPGSNGYGWTTFTVRNEDADAAEAALRSKGVQPPDGTTERDAALWRAFCQLLQDPEADVSMDHGGWLLLKGSLENAVDAEARANVAEPSMSTTSPSAYSVADAPAGYCVKGDDDCVCITNMHLCINFRQSIEGGAKP